MIIIPFIYLLHILYIMFPFEIYYIIFEYIDPTSDKFTEHFLINDITMHLFKKLVDEKKITNQYNINYVIYKAIDYRIFFKYNLHTIDIKFDFILAKICLKNKYYFKSIFNKLDMSIELLEAVIINLEYELIAMSIRCYLLNNKDYGNLIKLLLKYYDTNLIQYLKNEISDKYLNKIFEQLTSHNQIDLNFMLSETRLNLKQLLLLNEDLIKYYFNSNIELDIIDLEYSIVNHRNKFFIWCFTKLCKTKYVDLDVLVNIAFQVGNLCVLEKLLTNNNHLSSNLYKIISYRYPHLVNKYNLQLDKSKDIYSLHYKFNNSEYLEYFAYYDNYNYNIFIHTKIIMAIINNENMSNVLRMIKSSYNDNNLSVNYITEYFGYLIQNSILKNNCAIKIGLHYSSFINNYDVLQKICNENCYFGYENMVHVIFKYHFNEIDHNQCMQNAIKGNNCHIIDLLNLWMIHLNINHIYDAIIYDCNLIMFGKIILGLDSNIKNNILQVLKEICYITQTKHQFRLFIYFIRKFYSHISQINSELYEYIYNCHRGDEKLAILHFYNIKFNNIYDIDIIVNEEIYPDIIQNLDSDLEKFKNGLVKNNIYMIDSIKRKISYQFKFYDFIGWGKYYSISFTE